jgi:hypothetical protein
MTELFTSIIQKALPHHMPEGLTPMTPRKRAASATQISPGIRKKVREIELDKLQEWSAKEKGPESELQSQPRPDPPLVAPGTKTCRIAGPFLYDMLPHPCELSNECTVIEPSEGWEAVENEEEIYEMIDPADEDKVMMALWNRWGMVHK